MSKSLRAVVHTAVALCPLVFGAAQAQVVVVVNPKSALNSLSAEQVTNIYLGKTNALPNGAAAAAIDLPEGSPTRDQFYVKVTGKQSSQVRAAWARLVFSGKATPPRELAKTADVKRFVASNPDAIAYIEKSAVDDSVKVVLSVD